jgi:hypothetical protein
MVEGSALNFKEEEKQGKFIAPLINITDHHQTAIEDQESLIVKELNFGSQPLQFAKY